MHTLKKAFFLVAFSFFSQMLFSQVRITQCLAKLNRINQQGRLMFASKTVPEIFLNQEDGVLDLGDYFLTVKKVKVTYTYESRGLPNKKYHGVKYSCLEDDCINLIEVGYINNLSSFFKSRKNCYDYMNAFNELKKALE